MLVSLLVTHLSNPDTQKIKQSFNQDLDDISFIRDKNLIDPQSISTPNGAVTAKRHCTGYPSYNAQQHETSSGASEVMKLNRSPGTTSIATAANSVPQGRDL
ncbi:hypothetical protein PSTG_13273 [Puccinia striiformis f. sp. tritici PST-78]|uniref:Uncharacterized protein n=1 Tax=Puccinia striiformis f. sp. tritici PST-78 TaxID=1165861 RepID=A0A0L0V2C5_9BASI|nr:hypothetical protein PSTG_13273 [Puccinia striiformis f. sp. tritici PST-78]